MTDSVGGGGRGRRFRVLATLIEGAQLYRPYFTGFFTNPGGRKSFIGSGGYQGIEGVPPGGGRPSAA